MAIIFKVKEEFKLSRFIFINRVKVDVSTNFDKKRYKPCLSILERKRVNGYIIENSLSIRELMHLKKNLLATKQEQKF